MRRLLLLAFLVSLLTCAPRTQEPIEVVGCHFGPHELATCELADGRKVVVHQERAVAPGKWLLIKSWGNPVGFRKEDNE
jgi:hypothetical protein